jgi:diacylglycerol kinase family enzyme
VCPFLRTDGEAPSGDPPSVHDLGVALVPGSGPAVLIVSPLASRLRDAATRRRVTAATVAALRARGHGDVEVVETGETGAIGEAAAAAVRLGATAVVVAGGDGTVRDAAAALAETGITMGIVPAGAGNLYASAIGLPRRLEAAVALLATAGAHPFDLGEVRLDGPGVPAAALPFVAACGTGFDGRLMAATTRESKRRYGVAAYFLAASRLLDHLAPRPTVLTIDGTRTELESVVVLVVNAGEPIPGRLRPRLPVRPDDGQLHVFVLPRGGILGGVLGVLEHMAAGTAGTSATGAAVRLWGAHVRVEVDPPGPTEVDGDPFPAAALDARVRPGALLVIGG